MKYSEMDKRMNLHFRRGPSRIVTFDPVSMRIKSPSDLEGLLIKVVKGAMKTRHLEVDSRRSK